VTLRDGRSAAATLTEIATTQGATLAHHTPGRLRLTLPRGRNNSALLERVADLLRPLPGVENIETRAASGSIVLIYDPEEDQRQVASFLRSRQPAPQPAPKANGHARPRPETPLHNGHHLPPSNRFTETTAQIEEEAEFLAEHSHTASAIVDFCKDVDRKLKRATNNNLDLKIMVPLGLAAVTFLEIGAAAATPMWVTLAIFSLNHFVELHAHDGDDDDDDDDDKRDAVPAGSV
jgi:hypothetical protein